MYLILNKDMKKNLLSLIFLSFCNILISQLLPELPLKRDKIYYVFEDTFSNKKSCLGNYLKNDLAEIYEELGNNLIKKFKDKSYKIDKRFMSEECPVSFGLGRISLGCMDTILDGFIQYRMPTESLNFFDLTPIGLISGSWRKKTLYGTLTAEVELIFKSFNTLELHFKRFKLELMYMDYSEEHVNLSEQYMALKSKDKISNKEVQLFIFLDELLNLINYEFSNSVNYVINNE
jgi:hypothetical protein